MPDFDNMDELFDAPMDEASEFLQSQGVEAAKNWKQSAKIGKSAFTVTKLMNMDILNDVKQLLEKSMSEGTGFKEFKETFQQKMADQGWLNKEGLTEKEKSILESPSRLKLIYEQNIINSYSSARWKQLLESGFGYFKSVAVLDGRTTSQCRDLDNKVFRTNDKYYNKYLRVPRHFRCRSREVPIPDEIVELEGMIISKGSDFPKNSKGFTVKGKYKPDLSKYDKKLVDIANETVDFNEPVDLLQAVGISFANTLGKSMEKISKAKGKLNKYKSAAHQKQWLEAIKKAKAAAKTETDVEDVNDDVLKIKNTIKLKDLSKDLNDTVKRHLKKHGLKPEHLPLLLGIPNSFDGTVEIDSALYRDKKNHRVSISFQGTGRNGADIIAQRTFYVEKGVKGIDNDNFVITEYSSPKKLPFYKGKAIGALMLAGQVKLAEKLGVSAIRTFAAGKGSGKGNKKADGTYNGYYTWARLGYNDSKISHPLSTYIDKSLYKKEMGKDITNKEDIHSLMSTKKGRDFWQNHGSNLSMIFDPTKGSKSRKILKAYLLAKFGGKRGKDIRFSSRKNIKG